MVELIGSIAIFVILFGVIYLQGSIIKRQDARISDLLDRFMAKDFREFSVARERENQTLTVVKAEELLETLGQSDGLRVV